MRMPWKTRTESRIDIAIDKIHNFMEGKDPNTTEYTEAVKNLKELYEIKTSDSPDRINPNTILTVAAYIGVAGAVLLFEVFGHSITSKVMSVALPKPNIKIS